MKLSVSNIAWNPEEEEEVFELLLANGVSGVEVAPTKIWPAWQGADLETVKQYRSNIEKKGLEIPALQAILFDKPELQVFGDSETQSLLIAHLGMVAALANTLGAQILVFGSPKNRNRGDLSTEQAFAEGVNFFRRVGEVCIEHGTKLCLEPNPSCYDCNFMTHWHEVSEMVLKVSHPGVCLHLDTACITLAGDNVVAAINECAGKISHFHVTEPNLGDFSKPILDHAEIGRTLRESNYEGYLSIEMRRSEYPIKSIKEAVLRVIDWYC